VEVGVEFLGYDAGEIAFHVQVVLDVEPFFSSGDEVQFAAVDFLAIAYVAVDGDNRKFLAEQFFRQARLILSRLVFVAKL